MHGSSCKAFSYKESAFEIPNSRKKKNRKRKDSGNLPHTVCVRSPLSVSYFCSPFGETPQRQLQINTELSEISALRLENHAAQEPNFPARWIDQTLLMPPLQTVKRHILSQDWVAVKTCSRATFSNQREPICNTYPQILKQQSSVYADERNCHSFAEARRNNTNKMRTEDIWLNPNKGENPMKESYWPSWVLEA